MAVSAGGARPVAASPARLPMSTRLALVVLAVVLVGGCAKPPALERGLMLYEQGRYRRALATFDEAVRAVGRPARGERGDQAGQGPGGARSDGVSGGGARARGGRAGSRSRRAGRRFRRRP